MLKEIALRDLRMGMFVHRLGGRWFDHPFLRKSFKLTNAADLEKLLKSAVPDLVIDTDKGLDVESRPRAEPTPVAAPVAVSRAAETRITFDQEIERARAIQAKARVAVINMFGEARMGRAINVSGVAPLVDEISSSLERNAGALLSVVRLKTADDYTYMHSVAVCGLMIALGRRMGLEDEELRIAGLGGLLHDVGKIAMPVEVLNKPGKLTDEEYSTMKRHPLEGWQILRNSSIASEIPLDICLHHHERVDGGGYPEKISGDALTLYARMGAVCDVYDAITSDRPYKSGWAPAESIKRMAEWRVGQFDDTVFQAFVKTVGIYPVGSVVRLNSGRVGVVTDQAEANLLQPRVKVFFSLKSREPVKAEVVDLARTHDAIAGLEDAKAWQENVRRILG